LKVHRRTDLCYINKKEVDPENYPRVYACNQKKPVTGECSNANQKPAVEGTHQRTTAK
jgi:hypothetical protein